MQAIDLTASPAGDDGGCGSGSRRRRRAVASASGRGGGGADEQALQHAGGEAGARVIVIDDGDDSGEARERGSAGKRPKREKRADAPPAWQGLNGARCVRVRARERAALRRPVFSLPLVCRERSCA